jgi:hypothetical protein
MQRSLCLAMSNASASQPAERLWQVFVEAQERSKTSLALADGIAAGKAYAAFLEAFITSDLRIGRQAKGGGQ